MLAPARNGPRVFVTGLGLLTGLGSSAPATWRNLKASRSAVRVLDIPPAAGAPPYLGFPIPPEGRSTTPDILRAADEAARDAGLDFSASPSPRAGTVIGMSKGNLGLLARIHRDIGDNPGHSESPSWSSWPRTWPGWASAEVARRRGHLGPCLAPVAACATGVVAVLQAADLIRRGACDLVLAGAGDASLEPLVLGAFRRMKALARVGPDGDPATAVRPWDRARSGFLVGEGAAVLLLESESHALDRGALPYAFVAGGSIGSDAFHLTDLDPDPTNLAALILRALADAGAAPDEVDHVNVHGTATLANDPLECRAIRRALGTHAGLVACSANKAQIGHLLGAAGAAELAITCLALRDGFVPPTLNLDDPDPACDLVANPAVGRYRPIDVALKLSLGFGGHLAAAVLRRPEGPRRRPLDEATHPIPSRKGPGS